MLSRLFFNNIAPLLLRLRWRNVNLSLFKDKNTQIKLNNNIPKLNLPAEKKHKVLIGCIRSQAHSNLFEGGIGKAFKKAGYDVAVLRCGQYLTSCETKTYFKDNQMACSMCHIEFDSFKKAFDLDEVSYGSTISEELRMEIQHFANDVDLEKFRTWKGHDLYNEWTCALQRYYLSTDTKINSKPDTARQFLFTVISSFEVGRLLVSKMGFTHLVTSHGIYSTWGGLVSGFRLAGGNITVWGRGYYKSGIVSFKNESYLNGLKFFDKEYVLKRLNPKYIEEVKSYLDSKWKHANDNDSVKYYDKEKNSVTTDLNLKTDINYISFFPNIPWDGQAFVSTENYKGLRDVIESLIRYVDDNEKVHVIVRPHPAENPAYNPHISETFLDLAKEYDLLNHSGFTVIPYESTVTSYDIADKVKVSVLLAGTIAIELAAKGLNVIQLGRNDSSNKGLFFEPDTHEELAKTLDQILEPDFPLRNETTSKNALDWAAFYYCQAHVEDPIFQYAGYKMVDVKADINSNKLSKYLNWVLSGEGLYHID